VSGAVSTSTGRAGIPTGRSPEPTSTIAAFLGIWVLASLVSSLVVVAGGDPDQPTSIPRLAMSLLTAWAVFLAGTWWTSRRFGSGDARSDFALSARPIDLVGVPIGIATQLLAVPVVYLPLRVLWPDVFDDEALSETADDLVDRADGGLIVLLFVLVVVGAPLVEEVVYRGLLQRPLLDRFPPAPVIVGVAAVFALIHFRPVEFPGLFVAGLVFGVCAWRAGRVGAAVVAHVAFNATGLMLAL
jgi:membrane protease YdiL (CAAX protease family)